MTNWVTYPWRGDVLAVMDEQTREHICHMVGGGPANPEVMERARLIVQAVNAHADLLEALKYCQVRVFMAEGNSEAYEMARAAIARATGGTP